jgi:hypothetical protein
MCNAVVAHFALTRGTILQLPEEREHRRVGRRGLFEPVYARRRFVPDIVEHPIPRARGYRRWRHLC